MHNKSEEHIDKRFNDFFGVIMRLRSRSMSKDGEALTRRVDQLVMDYLYNAMTTVSYEKFLDYVKPLTDYRLLPLPLRTYTVKYLLFSLLTRSGASRKLLYKILSRK